MKKIYALLLVLSCLQGLWAQEGDYRPFVEEGKTWVCRNGTDYRTYVLSRDTVINNMTYKCLFGSENGGEAQYKGGVREEGSKVMWLKAFSDKEICQYDFAPIDDIFIYGKSKFGVSQEWNIMEKRMHHTYTK